MVHEIKKQIWLTKAENEMLNKFADMTCLTESEYIRMLIRNRIPKEKPGDEFYIAMNQLSQFSEQLQKFTNRLKEGQTLDADILQEEIQKWHGFQLDIEARFLAPEEAEWL